MADELITILQTRLNEYFPNFVSGLVLLVIGFFAGKLTAWVIKNFMESGKFEEKLKKAGIEPSFLETGFSTLIATIVKYYIYLMFFQASLQMLGIVTISAFVNMILLYIPTLIKAMMVLIITTKLGEYFRAKLRLYPIPHSNLLGLVIYVALSYIGAVMALAELFPEGVMVLTTIFAIILSSVGLGLAIGFGLAVGLGTKDIVSHYAKKLLKLKRK